MMAHDDGGFTIKDIPSDDARVGASSIRELSAAIKILAWAKKIAPKVDWLLEGKGPYRVRAK